MLVALRSDLTKTKKKHANIGLNPGGSQLSSEPLTTRAIAPHMPYECVHCSIYNLVIGGGGQHFCYKFSDLTKRKKK